MTTQEYHSYRFSSETEPSDDLLNQLMENAAERVRKSKKEASERFFAELRAACDKAKSSKTAAERI